MKNVYPCAARFDPEDALLVDSPPAGDEFDGCLVFDCRGSGPIVLDRKTVGRLAMQLRTWVFDEDGEAANAEEADKPEFVGVM